MSTPAGWYPDPRNTNQQRYWDGTQWTDYTHPPQPEPPADPPGGDGGPVQDQ